MSSLAAARADNFYYAPDFNPDVHKSLNKVCSIANREHLTYAFSPPETVLASWPCLKSVPESQVGACSA